LGSAVALVIFVSRVVEPWNGVMQRVAVTLALGTEVVTAARMLTRPASLTDVRQAGCF
jgi:hypothetical protein